MSTLNLEDIQGIVIRGYRMPMVRHFLLQVKTPAAARALLGRLVSGYEKHAPQITTAQEWHVGFGPGPEDDPVGLPRHKPDYCLNIGITWAGMLALEVRDRVPNLSFKSFAAFVAGAAERAHLVGDTGLGGPENWIGGFGTGNDVIVSGPENWIGGFGTGNDHVVVTLHALNFEAMRNYGLRLSRLFAEANAFEELWHGDGMALLEMQDGKPVPVPKVHFGYVDGITLPPNIRGAGAEFARPPGADRAMAIRVAG